ncbi:hypothetical protein EVC35_08165 [Oenococcus sicerae]|uniref:Uncharacterized protein n=2 Tax=Oenococcus sicerae TaxID=2203724 RepID=A0AAJ1RDV8_9LACO|nr:hypothetical protein [Oenococcus sicerae]
MSIFGSAKTETTQLVKITMDSNTHNPANDQAATDYEDIILGNAILTNAEYLKRNKIVSIDGQRTSLPNYFVSDQADQVIDVNEFRV